jgi:hypothetical protein
MKNKILNWIYKNNKKFFENKILDLDTVFYENKEYFELLFIKDFTGYIPKEVTEPTFKIFEEYSEMFERWTLWQSYYINRKVMSEPMKIPFYNGMLIYLKLLNTIAKVSKKGYVAPTRQNTENQDIKPKVEDFLEDISIFKKSYGKDI